VPRVKCRLVQTDHAPDVGKLQANSLAQALSTEDKRYITLETTVGGYVLDFILLPARKWGDVECLCVKHRQHHD